MIYSFICNTHNVILTPTKPHPHPTLHPPYPTPTPTPTPQLPRHYPHPSLTLTPTRRYTNGLTPTETSPPL